MPNANDQANARDLRMAKIWRKDLAVSDSAALDLHPFRLVRGQDVAAIARISHAAFQGGLDEASENEFLGKVSAILGGRYGAFIAAASWVHESPSGALDAAILVTDYAVYEAPVVALVVVAKTAQQRGIATALLSRSLAVLQQLGKTQCCARITSGNHACERLFLGCGFR